MTRITPRIRSVIFGCTVAAGLVFGGTRAIATPTEPAAPRVCDPRCATECDGFGGELRHWGCLCCG